MKNMSNAEREAFLFNQNQFNKANDDIEHMENTIADLKEYDPYIMTHNF